MLICLSLMVAGCSRSPQAAAATANLTEQIAQGKAVYEETCAQCHYGGEGSATAPDLKGSAVPAEPPAVLARIVLMGRSKESVVAGKKFNGTMPAQNTLSDEEIAAVVVYVREAMGGKPEPFPPQEVAKLR